MFVPVFIQALISLSMWNTITAVEAVSSLVTVPASIGNVLVAHVGDRISLTCTHENAGSLVTVWNITAPIDCTAVVVHLANVMPPSCGPFTLKNVSVMSPFTSMAVANASLSMSGSVVQCRDGLGESAMQIGQKITLCITDDPLPPRNLRCLPMSNGIVRCSWDAVPQDCAMDSISYHLVIIVNGGSMAVTTDSTNTIETFSLVPGQEYVALLSTAIGGAVPRRSVATVNVFTALEIVTTVTPTTNTAIESTMGLPTIVTCSCSNSVGSVVAITFIITAVFMLTMGVVIGALCAVCIVKKKHCCKPATTDYVASSGPVYDEVSQSKGNFQGDLQLEQNIAYGHVKRNL